MILTAIIAGFALREGFLQMIEVKDRQRIFTQARNYADSLSKPLLVVGTPKWGFNHGCGDVTIDIQPGMGGACEVEIGDVRDIPYPDNTFGAAFCSHVLEHLNTIDDALQALNEMERVAERVFTASPHKSSLMAQLYPGHHLWITPTGDGYLIEQRGSGGHREESYVIAMSII